MRSDPTATALRDMLHHISLVERFLAGFDYAAFQSDERTVYAITRRLEIISEASRRLPEELKGRHPNIEWKRIAGAGNVYRHDYEDVAPRYLWETVKNGLPPLRAVVVQELGEPEA